MAEESTEDQDAAPPAAPGGPLKLAALWVSDASRTRMTNSIEADVTTSIDDLESGHTAVVVSTRLPRVRVRSTMPLVSSGVQILSSSPWMTTPEEGQGARAVGCQTTPLPVARANPLLPCQPAWHRLTAFAPARRRPPHTGALETRPRQTPHQGSPRQR